MIRFKKIKIIAILMLITSLFFSFNVFALHEYCDQRRDSMADVLIIGGGPAGLTAAIYARRAGLSVAIFENSMYGGQSSLTSTIENYPGFETISGADLAEAMYQQATKLGAEFIFDEVKSVDLKANEKTVVTNSNEFKGKSVIIANGLKRRLLGCKGENEFAGRGVSYCATCDGSLFKGKTVAIVGGGNTALEDAIYLSNICEKVVMVVRKDRFRGENHLVQAANKINNIEMIMGSNITEIKGDKIVESVIISNNNCDGKEVLVSGVFVAIGYEPNNEIYKGQVQMDSHGYFISDETCATNIPGVYVAGDCRIKPLRQIITAAADGAVAASQASKFILQS